MRKYLLDNYTIEELTTNINGFENVASNQIILTILNKESDVEDNVKYFDYSTKKQSCLVKVFGIKEIKSIIFYCH